MHLPPCGWQSALVCQNHEIALQELAITLLHPSLDNAGETSPQSPPDGPQVSTPPDALEPGSIKRN